MVSPANSVDSDDKDLVSTNRTYLMRNAVRQPSLKWPDGRVPYSISTQYTGMGRQRIAQAIDEYHEKTCIRFVPKTDADFDYVHVLPEEGCYSLVGKVGGKQPVSLGKGCIVKGIIIHELMHSVGFFHEQSRADRDDFVKIVWSNVESGLEDQFDKYSLAMIDHLNAEYDYGSVMHYAQKAFSKNGHNTLEPTHATSQKIGQRVGFSATDSFKINKLYNCPANKVEPAAAPVQSSSVAFGQLPLSVAALPDNAVQQASCADQRRDCDFLAQRGHCTSPYAQLFMRENCARSCGLCEEGSADGRCTDRKPWCQRWAGAGMCELFLFSGYMREQCAKSCASC